MKKLEIKKTTLKLNADSEDVMDYAELIRYVLAQVPQHGLTPDVMRKRMRILDAVDKATDGVIQLEDADANVLKSTVNNAVWSVMHQDILDFTDAVDGMETA